MLLNILELKCKLPTRKPETEPLIIPVFVEYGFTIPVSEKYNIL